MAHPKNLVSKFSLLLAMTFFASGVYAQNQIDEIVVTAQKREQSITDVPISVQVLSGEKILEQGFNDLEEAMTFMPGVLVAQGDTRSATVRVRGISTVGANTSFEQSVAVFNDGIYYGRSLQSTAGLFDVSQIEVLYGPQPVYFGQSAIAGLISYGSTRPSAEGVEGYAIAEGGTDAFTKFEGAVNIPLSDSWAIRAAGKITETDGWTEVFNTGEDGNASEDTAFRVSLQGDFTDNLSFFLKSEQFEQNSKGAPSATVSCDPLTASVPPPGRGIVICDNAEAAGLANYGYEDFLVNKGGSESAAPLNRMPAGNLDLTTLPFAENAALGIDIEGSNSLAEFEWQINEELILSSLTGYAEYESLGIEDFDGTPYASLMFPNAEDFEMLSQEFRIQSDSDDALNWMAGLYFQDQELGFSNNILAASPTPMGPSGANATEFREEAEYFGVFASFNYDVSDSVTLSYGLRYSDVEKDAYLWEVDSFLTNANGDRITNTGPGGRTVVPNGTQAFGYSGIIPELAAGDRCLGNTPNGDDCDATILAQANGAAILAGMGGNTDLTLAENDVNHQFSLNYTQNDNATYFVRYVDGFKPGGFSRGSTSFTSELKGRYEAEEASSIEVGGRFNFLDDALTLNAVFYSTDYENQQVSAQVIDPVTLASGQIFINAAESTVKGFEADLAYANDNGFRLFMNGALTLGQFDSYDNAGCWNIENAAGDCFVVGTQNAIDLSGTDFDGQPDWTMTVGLSQDISLSDTLLLKLGADLSLYDDFDDTRPTSAKFDYRSQDGFSVLNLRAAISDVEGVWEVAAYGRNVTDELYWLIQPIQPGPFGTANAGISRPANYGVQLRYNF